MIKDRPSLVIHTEIMVNNKEIVDSNSYTDNNTHQVHRLQEEFIVEI